MSLCPQRKEVGVRDCYTSASSTSGSSPSVAEKRTFRASSVRTVYGEVHAAYDLSEIPNIMQPPHIVWSRDLTAGQGYGPEGRLWPASTHDLRYRFPRAILLKPAVLYIPSTAMYNAAMHTRVSSLALRDA